ncbi:hypothetical protein V8C34DRAFT_152663 [Trichoderma compactum]
MVGSSRYNASAATAVFLVFGPALLKQTRIAICADHRRLRSAVSSTVTDDKSDETWHIAIKSISVSWHRLGRIDYLVFKMAATSI